MSDAESKFLSGAAKAGKTILTEDGKTVETVRWPEHTPILDEVVVRPLDPPTKSKGGVLLARTSQLAERAMTCVGQIVAMGSQCYTAKTRDGVDYALETRKPKVGDWVLFTKAAGQGVSVKHPSASDPTVAPRQLVIKDSDIKAVFKDEENARLVWSWVH